MVYLRVIIYFIVVVRFLYSICSAFVFHRYADLIISFPSFVIRCIFSGRWSAGTISVFFATIIGVVDDEDGGRYDLCILYL